MVKPAATAEKARLCTGLRSSSRAPRVTRSKISAAESRLVSPLPRRGLTPGGREQRSSTLWRRSSAQPFVPTSAGVLARHLQEPGRIREASLLGRDRQERTQRRRQFGERAPTLTNSEGPPNAVVDLQLGQLVMR